mmetsp:Transcript_17284/g.53576  ORF Transcript_17284/g.53576 Transcript_17284/m.53576 type:complete len:224 (+) Transcript_17284:269-940(+)
MLVVATTEGMLHRVHRNTAHLGPLVALHAVLVVRGARAQHGLLRAAAARGLAHRRTARRGHDLLLARRQLEARLARVGVVRDHNAEVARGARQRAAVARLGLNVAHHGALGALGERQHVADHQLRLLAGVDELAGVGALGAHEQLLLVLVAQRVAERHLGQRRTAARVVDDVGHNTLDVAVALGVVERAQLGRALAVVRLGHEHGTRALTLRTDHATHGGSEY